MKRHNFILKEYEKTHWKREENWYRRIVLSLITFNVLAFSLLSYISDEVDTSRSKTVFSKKEENVTIKKDNYIYIFDLRERIEKYLNKSVRIESFFCESGKIKVEVIGAEETHCIEFLKALEEKEEFYILGLSTIENTDVGFKVSFDISTKESGYRE